MFLSLSFPPRLLKFIHIEETCVSGKYAYAHSTVLQLRLLKRNLFSNYRIVKALEVHIISCCDVIFRLKACSKLSNSFLLRCHWSSLDASVHAWGEGGPEAQAILMQENGAEQDLNPKILQSLPSFAPASVACGFFGTATTMNLYPPATSAVPLISSTPASSAAASSTDHTSVRERVLRGLIWGYLLMLDVPVAQNVKVADSQTCPL
ncbi:hypothetical protein POTOM_005628 [Populus tomentosa]|uniref:Uncharacterized protein n=1 Tax=Populus tomentosa TaxID=118781 RepID=A0A8X8ALT9_POPTO|nr:hypothetical protein POTOM_005628 [Populus tomentosa]